MSTAAENEPDVTPIIKLTFWAIGIIVAVIFSVFIVRQLVLNTTATMRTASLPENSERMALESRTRANLHAYGYVKRDEGTYRVPIKAAMKLVVDDPSLLTDPDRLTKAKGDSSATGTPATGQ